MASADGSILIRTKVDTTGIRTGTQSIQKGVSKVNTSLLKLGATIFSVFSVVAIFNFGKQAIKSASELSNAMIGLKSIVDGTGNSFERANKFIQEYISDGLVPATNAITAYKNLLMRGYSIDQIEQTMVALKDSSAFGRQASLSLGDAVQSATEGLKNENSILVDNAGVTKNVAKMWEDYAKSIGKSTKDLTKNEKILAEVNGIMEETRFQVGDAAKVAQTWGGQISALNVKWQQFLVLVGGRLIQVLTPAVKVLNNLLTLALSVGNAISKIFGWESATESITSSTSENVADTAESQENVASAAKDTNKALKKQLAFFDDINVLSSETATSGTGASTGTTATTGGGVSVIPSESETEKKLTVLEQKIKSFFENLNKLLQPTIEAFNKLWDGGLALFGDFTWTALKDFYDEFLVPMAKWSFGSKKTGFARLLKIINEDLSKIKWDKLNKSLKDFWKAIEPYAEEFGEGLIDFFDEMGDFAVDIINLFPGVFDGITTALNNGDPEDARTWGKALGELAIGIIAVKTAVKISAGMTAFLAWVQSVGASLGGITGVVGALSAFNPGMIGEFGLMLERLSIGTIFDSGTQIGLPKIIDELEDAIFNSMVSLFDSIFSFDATEMIFSNAMTNFENMKEAWAEQDWLSVGGNLMLGILNGILGAVAFITEPIVDIFVLIGESMYDGLVSGFDGIQKFFINMLNGIIGFFEGFVNEFIWGINVLIDGINTLPGIKLKLLNDVDFGRIALPSVATGNSVPQNSAFQQAMLSPFATSPAVMQQVMNATGNGSANNNQPVILNMNGTEVARTILPDVLAELSRQGYDTTVLGAN